jgi:HK97 family phage major capsid protein
MIKKEKRSRSKIDIANDREVKKRELEKLIEGIEGEQIREEDQAKIDALEEKIAALEEELEAVAAPEPNGERGIKVVGGGQDVEKRFSLLRAVRNHVENRAHDPIAQAVIDTGRNELARAGIASNGHITLPENRDAVQATVAGKGLEAIATEKLDLIGPLYQELSLNKVGATFLTGLVSDVSIPVYSGTTTGWAGEIAPAQDGAGTFKDIKLRPKRLTAVVDVSRQFLLQDSVSADALLRSDILEAIRQKLEQTLLGAAAGTDLKPAGLFYVGSSLEKFIVTNYKELLDVELELLNRNATPKFYLASPTAYANLRQIAKPEATVTDSNQNITVGASIVNSNTVSGIPLIVSSNVYAGSLPAAVEADPAPVVVGGYLLGDFSNFVIAQWGNIDLIIDPNTRAVDGIVRLVVNAYFDAALKRPSVLPAFTYLPVPEPPESKKTR